MQISDAFTPSRSQLGLAVPITSLTKVPPLCSVRAISPPCSKRSSVPASSEKALNAVFPFQKATVKINDRWKSNKKRELCRRYRSSLPYLLFSQTLAQGLRLHPFHNVPRSRPKDTTLGIKNGSKPRFFKQHPELSCSATANGEKSTARVGCWIQQMSLSPKAAGFYLFFF